MERPGGRLREQLLDGVWGNDIYIDERTVDVHVGRLRKALNRGHASRSDPHRARRRLFARRPLRQSELEQAELEQAELKPRQRAGRLSRRAAAGWYAMRA